MHIGHTDVDKDGKINEAEFDGLCEEVASLPRRFGLAACVSGYTAVDKDGKINEAESDGLWKDSPACREFYGMLAMRFGDTDVDRDGKINEAEFDGSCEEVATFPRRFGLAACVSVTPMIVARRRFCQRAVVEPASVETAAGEPATVAQAKTTQTMVVLARRWRTSPRRRP